MSYEGDLTPVEAWEFLKANEGAVLLDIRTDETDRARAQKNVEDTLVKYPDIAGLVGLWNYNGPAIRNAVRSAGLIGKVKIVCFDENAETLEGVAAGDIYGTVVQQPYEFGKQAITRMAQYLNGQAPGVQGLMGNYLEQSRKMFGQMQEQMAKQAGVLFPGMPGFVPPKR